MPRIIAIDPRAMLAVALGGCVGGLLRYAAAEVFPDRAGVFPWTIFAVNVLGAALLALLVTLILAGLAPRPYLREFAGVGVLGSFTTFSTWMAQSHHLAADDRPDLAALYLGGSLAAGLLAAVAGVLCARALARPRSR